MNFAEAEKYLYSLGNEVETMKLGLENIGRLLHALGEPHTKYFKVQVAGTNGKGSVCAFVDSICLEAGIGTGLYTSPHLVSITERVRIGGVDIDEAEFARLATQVRTVSEDLAVQGVLERVPTFFEQVTAIALLAFAEAGVELAILETGLGGRFDATTAANAEIAVITRIDLDHQEYLGDTIEQIAAEKAAIIRADSHVVIGRQPERALKVIHEQCTRVGAAVSSDLYDPWTIVSNEDGTVRIDTECTICPSVSLGLKGRHQIENAKTALNVIQVLKYDSPFDLRFDIEGTDAFAAGIMNARHPGRLEWIGRFLLDGAHNISGALALREYLDEFVTEPLTLVFGAMRDKSAQEMLALLAPKADSIILTKPDNARALEPQVMADLLPGPVEMETVTLSDTVKEALEIAAGRSERGIILVTGSLYLVGEAVSNLRSEIPNLKCQI